MFLIATFSVGGLFNDLPMPPPVKHRRVQEIKGKIYTV